MEDRAGDVSDAHEAYGEQRRAAHRLAAAVLVLLTGGIAGIALAGAADTDRADQDETLVFSAALALVAVAALQMYHARVAISRQRRPRWCWSLVVQALLTYAPLWVFGVAWAGVSALLSASVLLVIVAPWSWVAFVGVAAADVAAAFAAGLDVHRGGYAAVATSVTGLVAYSVLRLASEAGVPAEIRAEAAARAAVDRERRRIERDLHDLVGHSLSSVILKSELASRLVDTDPAGVRRELAEVVTAARRALAEVRAVPHGQRRLSLSTELASARAMLRAAGIDCDLTMSLGTVPAAVSDVLASVLREGVTNVVRHSHARTCRIEGLAVGDVVRLAVGNDGAPPTTRTTGAGITSLSERVYDAGGGLTVRQHAGWFELVAVIPRTPRA